MCASAFVRAATVKTWSDNFTDPVSNTSITYSDTTLYDQSQRGYAFQASFVDGQTASAQIFKGTGGNNTITIGTDADGKVYITVNSTTVTTEDAVITGPCVHTFVMLIRRGFTNSNQDKCIRLYMDGSLLLEQVDSVNKWNGGPMTTAAFGDSTKTGNLYTGHITARESAVASEADDYETIPVLLADAATFYPTTWGNAGSSFGGVASREDGSFGMLSFALNFTVNDHIINTGIGNQGKVKITSVKLMNRSGGNRIPDQITLSQASGASITSSSPTAGTGMMLFSTNRTALVASRDYTQFDFTDETQFDPSEDITVSFRDKDHNGFSVMQVSNSKMYGASGSENWSPVIEISATYTPVFGTTYTASVAGDVAFDDIVWSPEKPSGGFVKNDKLVITATGTPTITFAESVSSEASLTINGAVEIAAGDGLYEDGCFLKVFGQFAKLTADSATFAPVKEGFTGAYGKTTTAFTLRGQNMEVISINFANGHSVSGTDYTGLAPVQGNTWMNMTTTWSGGKTVDLGTIKATVDGTTTKDMTSATGSCYAANTYGWTSATDVFLKGYLDDGGNQAQVTVTGLLYPTYDVIVYFATDTASRMFRAVTVNDTTYTYDSDAPDTAKVGTDNWGESRGLTAAYGTNAIRIRNLSSSTLAIVGGTNGDGARGGIAAIQIVATSELEAAIDYYLTMDGDADASTAAWTPEKTGSFTVADTITITNVAAKATFTADEDITVHKLKIVSGAGKLWVFKKNAGVSTDFGALDFSEAVEGVGYDCTEGFTACHLLLDYARTHDEKFTFFGADENGALIDYGTAQKDYTFSGHYIFDAGTHTFQQNSDSQYLLFGKNATVENPTFWVKNGATLNWKARNPCGWNASASTAGIVRIGSGSKVVPMITAENAGTWYWSQQFYFEAGSTLEIGTTGDNFRTVGNDENAPHFYMPASENGIAQITGGTDNYLTVPANDYGAMNFEVGEGSTLIVSANLKTLTDGKPFGKYGAGVLKLTGDISAFYAAVSVYGGKIEFATESGDAPFVNVATNGGEFVVSGAGTIVFKNYRGAVTVKDTAKAGYVVDINDIGQFKVPSGMKASDIRLYDGAGNAVSYTIDGDKLKFDWNITDGACWWDYEFNGNVKSTGSDTTEMTQEGTHPFYNTESNALWVGHATHYRGASYPAEFTAVTYGKMVSNQKHVLMGFGSTTGGTKYNVALACGDPANDEVLLLISQGSGVLEAVSMRVSNAYTADHLYAFSCSTVMDGSVEKTQIAIYLDGKRLKTYTFGSKVTLGTGFQIGSVHGGVPTGYIKATTANANSFLDFLRLYEVALTDEAMAKYASEYPYVSVNGKASRTFAGDANWTEDDAWLLTPYEGDPYPTNRPNAKAMVSITATEQSTVTFDLVEDTNYESLDALAGSPIVLRTGGDVKPAVAGFTTVGTDLTLDYDAISLVGPVSVLAGKTLTFDFANLDVAGQWKSVTNVLTGPVTIGEGAQVVAVNLGSAAGRTVEFLENPLTGQYELRVTVSGVLTADLTGSTSFGSLVWKLGETVVTPDWSKAVVGTIHVLANNPTLTFAGALVSEGAQINFDGAKAVTLAANANVSGVSYDFTGLAGNRVTFKYKPEMAKVNGHYVRYDLDMGQIDIGTSIADGSTNEFLKATLSGVAGQGGRTVRVPEGDVITLKGGHSDVRASVSLDVCGGTVYLAPVHNAAVWYGDSTTRFNLRSGTVYAQTTGQGQSGNGNGLLLGWSGAPKEFNVTGGLLDASGSSLNLWSATVTINLSGGTIRAKGAFAGSQSGVLNLTDSGVLEIGSLGVTANAFKTFNLAGGTLCGFEADARMSCAVTLGGDSTLTSASEASLTLAGAMTGSGVLTLPDGTVKLGAEGCLGTGSVVVTDGGTLDVNGFKPTNAITLAGSGSNGTGALANTGGDVSWLANLTLTDDASIGGTAVIGLNQGSDVNLGGYTLTVNGTGVTVKLGGFTFTGGGLITVHKGTLASNGATALGSANLTVNAEGTLDLSHGNHISCHDFTSAGTVTGTNATLIVNGTLNASRSKVTVTRLRLADDAVLRLSGSTDCGLSVKTVFEFGSTLLVETADVATNIKIAEVPADPLPLEGKRVSINGDTTTYSLVQSKTTLFATSGGILAHIQIDSVSGWTNFEEMRVTGLVGDFYGSSSGGATNVNIVVTAGDGTSVTQKFALVSDADGHFAYAVKDVIPGQTYDVMAFITIEGAEVDAQSDVMSGINARTVDGWIYENARTFAELDPGSGIWDPTDGIACVSNGVIWFTAQNWEKIIEFQPTNESQVIRSSSIRDLHYRLAFASPGLYTFEPFAIVPEDWIAAITLVADENDNCRFAVVSNGVWVSVDSPVVAQVGREYDIMIRTECDNWTNVVYDIIVDGETNHLAECAAEMPSEEVVLPIAGCGAIAEIRGLCQDVNLLQVGDREYDDFDEARDAAGETMDIVPLWYSRFDVTGKKGRFRIYENGLLDLLWQKWHHVTITQDDKVNIYDYLSGNNWIEYADVAGVETNDLGEIVVNTPEGLAWVAECATNGWFGGTVTLGRDIDLTAMNWTPVAQFSGTFDGNGRTIFGLNNTNELAELGDLGVYLAGPTNDWGVAAYGLFGTATNAVFRNVTLADVAIDNYASAVSTLLGVHMGGFLSVSNVTVASGAVVGESGAVAGVIGTSEGWGDLAVVNNTNAAWIVGRAENSADPRWAAGILTVGGTEDVVGAMVVTGNVNSGTISNVGLCNNADGGNVAQILAGTTWGTIYGDVQITNNVAIGEVVADIANHDGWRLGEYDSWITEVFPVCNLAPAVTYFTEEDGYRRFIEANNPRSIPVDPVYHTARMSASVFQNGSRNYAGEWMDTITAMHEGERLWITGSLLTNDTWQTVLVDRSVAFDLRGNTICTVYDDTTFRITNDSCLSISNGTILVPEGGKAFDCVGTSIVESNDIRVVYTPADFYDRFVTVGDALATVDMFLGALNYLPSGTNVGLDGEDGLAFDASSNAVTFNGQTIATMGFRSLAATTAGDGSVSYVVELNNTAVPEFDLDASSVASPDGTVTISLAKTHAGLYYAVQHKTSLVENWSEPIAADWQFVEHDGEAVRFTLPAENASGFYRVKVTDIAPSAK